MIVNHEERSLETDFSPQAAGDSSPALEPATGSAARGKRRILIVDNDSNSTHLVKVLLEKSGAYQVLEETDATKAHQTARRFKPDVILLDIVMPAVDGGEVAAQIQTDRDLHNTPIIFLTALVTKAEAESGLQVQGHPFVAKPINIPELIDAIEHTSASDRLVANRVRAAAHSAEIIVAKIQRRAQARLQLRDFPGRDRRSPRR